MAMAWDEEEEEELGPAAYRNGVDYAASGTNNEKERPSRVAQSKDQHLHLLSLTVLVRESIE
jgi:hypothetical protein